MHVPLREQAAQPGPPGFLGACRGRGEVPPADGVHPGLEGLPVPGLFGLPRQQGQLLPGFAAVIRSDAGRPHPAPGGDDQDAVGKRAHRVEPSTARVPDGRHRARGREPPEPPLGVGEEEGAVRAVGDAGGVAQAGGLGAALRGEGEGCPRGAQVFPALEQGDPAVAVHLPDPARIEGGEGELPVRSQRDLPGPEQEGPGRPARRVRQPGPSLALQGDEACAGHRPDLPLRPDRQEPVVEAVGQIDLSTASHRDPHGTVQVDLQWRPGTAHAIQGVRASDLAGSPDRLEPALPGDPHHPVAAPVGGDEVAPGRKARVKGQGGGQERGGGMAGGGESHGSSRKEVVGPERSKLEVNISIII